MARWSEIDSVAATLTGVAELRFAANRHHVLGTIRPDGSPRLSGTEVYFHRGDVWIGCMPTSGKVSDLRRDPRCALHTAPIDLEMVEGDAVIDAVAVETEDADVWAAITEGSGCRAPPSTTVGRASTSAPILGISPSTIMITPPATQTQRDLMPVTPTRPTFCEKLV